MGTETMDVAVMIEGQESKQCFVLRKSFLISLEVTIDINGES